MAREQVHGGGEGPPRLAPGFLDRPQPGGVQVAHALHQGYGRRGGNATRRTLSVSAQPVVGGLDRCARLHRRRAASSARREEPRRARHTRGRRRSRDRPPHRCAWACGVAPSPFSASSSSCADGLMLLIASDRAMARPTVRAKLSSAGSMRRSSARRSQIGDELAEQAAGHGLDLKTRRRAPPGRTRCGSDRGRGCAAAPLR